MYEYYNDDHRQPPFDEIPFGQQFGPPFGGMPPGQQFAPPFGGTPPGQQFGPPFGGTPPGQQFGPPFEGTPPGQQFGPPFGGGPSGPPPGPPPSFTPQLAQPQGGPGVFAVDPGAIRPCVFRYVYILLDTGERFWAWLVYVGRRSVAGWRWTGRRWVYFGVDLRDIVSFTCY